MDYVDGKTALLLSSAMACEIMQMIISNSLDKYSGISDQHFGKLSYELGELKTSLVKSIRVNKENHLFSLIENGYICKRLIKIASLLKNNSDSRLNEDLQIALNLSRLSLNGLISLLKNELRLIKDGQIKNEIESSIESLLEEDEFYKKLMDSPDY